MQRRRVGLAIRDPLVAAIHRVAAEIAEVVCQQVQRILAGGQLGKLDRDDMSGRVVVEAGRGDEAAALFLIQPRTGGVQNALIQRFVEAEADGQWLVRNQGGVIAGIDPVGAGPEDGSDAQLVIAGATGGAEVDAIGAGHADGNPVLQIQVAAIANIAAARDGRAGCIKQRQAGIQRVFRIVDLAARGGGPYLHQAVVGQVEHMAVQGIAIASQAAQVVAGRRQGACYRTVRLHLQAGVAGRHQGVILAAVPTHFKKIARRRGNQVIADQLVEIGHGTRRRQHRPPGIQQTQAQAAAATPGARRQADRNPFAGPEPLLVVIDIGRIGQAADCAGTGATLGQANPDIVQALGATLARRAVADAGHGFGFQRGVEEHRHVKIAAIAGRIDIAHIEAVIAAVVVEHGVEQNAVAGIRRRGGGDRVVPRVEQRDRGAQIRIGRVEHHRNPLPGIQRQRIGLRGVMRRQRAALAGLVDQASNRRHRVEVRRHQQPGFQALEQNLAPLRRPRLSPLVAGHPAV